MHTSGTNSGHLPAAISKLKSKYAPSGGNFLNVINSYSEMPKAKISTYCIEN